MLQNRPLKKLRVFGNRAHRSAIGKNPKEIMMPFRFEEPENDIEKDTQMVDGAMFNVLFLIFWQSTWDHIEILHTNFSMRVYLA